MEFKFCSFEPATDLGLLGHTEDPIKGRKRLWAAVTGSILGALMLSALLHCYITDNLTLG